MTVLFYEDCWEGFLSAVFEAYRTESVTLRRHGQGQTVLFDVQAVALDPNRARRVERGMESLGIGTAERLYHAWLSEEEGSEDDIVRYMRVGFSLGRDPAGHLVDPVVGRVTETARRTAWEAHRMLQFVRFVATPEGIYVADISPRHNVLTLIADHFHGRFGDQRLIIRDIGRRLALVSSGEGWHITRLGEEPLPPLPQDSGFEDLWRGYFKAISNPARKNLRLQQQFVPLRFRAHMTEFNGPAPR